MAKKYQPIPFDNPFDSSSEYQPVPSYERLQDVTQDTLGQTVKRGLVNTGITTLQLGLKTLDIPRIVLTDVLGNVFEGMFGFMFDVSKGEWSQSVKTLASNFGEVFTDTASDVFKLDLQTEFDGQKIADEYYRMFGTSYDEVSPYVRWIPTVGFEILTDPTSYLTAGATGLVKGLAKQASKEMSEQVAKRSIRYISRLNVIASDEKAKLFLSDVISATQKEGTESAVKYMDKVADTFNLTGKIEAAEKEVADNLPKYIAQYMGEDEIGKSVTGYYVNIYGALGKLNNKVVRASTEYIRREKSGYTEMLERLTKYSDDELKAAGFSADEIVALRNPIVFGDKAVRNVKIGVYDLADRARLLGEKMDVVDDIGSVSAQEILNASRKHGGELQFYEDMFTINPNAQYWAFSQDLRSVALNPDKFAQNIRTANNVSRALGVGWYSNPFWYFGKLVGTATNPKGTALGVARAVGGLTDKRTYATLFGRTSHPFVQNVADVFSDPLMGANPASTNWLERLVGDFFFTPNAPEFAEIADEAIQTTQAAYGMAINRAQRTFEMYGDNITGFLDYADSNEFCDLLQLSVDQRAAYSVLKSAQGVSAKQVARVMEAAGEGGDGLSRELFDEIGLSDELFDAYEAFDKRRFTNESQYKWVGALRGMYDDVIELESAFGVGTKRLSDSLSYYPMEIRTEVYQHLEKFLTEKNMGDVFASIKHNLSDNFTELLRGKVAMRSLRNLPLSFINEGFKSKGVDFLDEIGILDAFTKGLQKDSAAYAQVVAGLGEYFEKYNAMGILRSQPVDAMHHRIKRHFYDSVMTSYYGLLKQSGYTIPYEYGASGVLAEQRLRSALGKEAFDKDGVALPAEELIRKLSQVQTAQEGVEILAKGEKEQINANIVRRINSLVTGKDVRRYWVGQGTDAATKASQLGYVNADGWVANIAPADLKSVFGNKRVKYMQNDKLHIIDVDKGLHLKGAKGGSGLLVEYGNRIRQLSSRLAKSTKPEEQEKILEQLSVLKEQHDRLLSGASDAAKAKYAEISDVLAKRQEKLAKYGEALEDYEKARRIDPSIAKPVAPEPFDSDSLLKQLSEFDEEFFDLTDAAKNLPFNKAEEAATTFKRLHPIKKKALPALKDGHTVAVSRRKLVELIDRLELSAEAKDQEFMQDLYDLVNKADMGFVDLSGNAMRLAKIADAAANNGVKDVIEQVPVAVLQGMAKINVNIRAVSNANPNVVVAVVKEISGFMQKTALWGLSILPSNILGNSIFATQGGISANVLSHLNALLHYFTIAAPLKMGVGSKEAAGKTYIPKLKMTRGEFMEKCEALGITQGWIRSLHNAVDEGGITKYWAKNVDESLGKEKWYKRLTRATKKALSLPGVVISFVADEPWRFMYAYDLVGNQGYTLEEAAKLTKEYFGDFSPLKSSKFDRAAQDWMFFYRFKKFNAIQQARLMAKDPKWASFTAKVMRSYQAGSTEDELAMSRIKPVGETEAFSVTRRDEKGDVWDRDGKLLRSQYATFNPFGSWYSPADAVAWLNPYREGIESLVFNGDITSEQGFFESLTGGIDLLRESIDVDNPEVKRNKRAQALALLTNSSRLLRYMKPFIQGKEEAHRDAIERATRFMYVRYDSLQNAVSVARTRLKQNDPENEENARLLHKLDRTFYQLRTLRERRPQDLMPFDMPMP